MACTHTPDCFFVVFTLVLPQPTPNDLLVAASSYGLVGYHQDPASPTRAGAAGTASEPVSSSSRAGLLSTVNDAAGPVASSSSSTHQPVNRHGNLDWLIHSLNTNLPDPAALIREPNLTPNLKHLVSHNNGSPNGTQRSPQHVAFADEKSPLNQHQSNSSSPARNLGPLLGYSNTNNKFPSVSL